MSKPYDHITLKIKKVPDGEKHAGEYKVDVEDTSGLGIWMDDIEEFDKFWYWCAFGMFIIPGREVEFVKTAKKLVKKINYNHRDSIFTYEKTGALI